VSSWRVIAGRPGRLWNRSGTWSDQDDDLAAGMARVHGDLRGGGRARTLRPHRSPKRSSGRRCSTIPGDKQLGYDGLVIAAEVTGSVSRVLS
jgi:hypothetical protein